MVSEEKMIYEIVNDDDDDHDNNDEDDDEDGCRFKPIALGLSAGGLKKGSRQSGAALWRC